MEDALQSSIDLEENVAPRQLSLVQKFYLNLKLIFETLQHKEISRVLIFFAMTGCLIPNF